MDCVFCKIRDGQIPSVKIYDDERTFAIMDINPLNEGHLLVIPKAHAPTVYEIADDDLGRTAVVAKRIALALQAALRPEGLNILQANGAAAFQSVHFTLMESGDIRARAAFIVNRPQHVARVDIDPVGWGFQLADLMTFNMASRVMAPVKQVAERLPLRVTGVDPIGVYISVANFLSAGRAASELGHSMTVLEKRMLMQHFMQHYEMLINSLLAWRKVSDWTDAAKVPEYCRKGLAR